MADAAVRLLAPDDLPLAVRLSTEAGWNQTPQDWLRLIAFAPDGCFGIECDGRMVSTATVVRYGRPLGWIGMVLTLDAYRGRGYATRLMRRCLEHCEETDVACVKLDATDMGRPLYQRLGFVDEYPVERWLREGSGPVPARATPPPAVDFDPTSILSLDRAAFGADRGVLLELLRDWGEGHAVEGGYAMSRPGRKWRQFGPCVARTEAAAHALAEGFLRRHGSAPALWDLCPEHPSAPRLAASMGFRPARRLVRMRRGPAVPGLAAQSDLVWALAGFEYG